MSVCLPNTLSQHPHNTLLHPSPPPLTTPPPSLNTPSQPLLSPPLTTLLTHPLNTPSLPLLLSPLSPPRETDDTVAVVGNILDADSEVIGRMSLVVTMTFPDFGDATAQEPGLVEQGPGLGLEQGSGMVQGQGLGPGLSISSPMSLSLLQGADNSTTVDNSPLMLTGLGQAQAQGLDGQPTTLNTLPVTSPQEIEPIQPLDRPPRAGKGLARDGEDFQRKRQQLVADMQNLRSSHTPADNAMLQQRQTMLMQAQQQQLLAQSQPPTQYDRTGYPINTPLVTKPNLHLVSDPSFAHAQGLAQKVVGSMLEQVIASFVALETQSDFYRPSTGAERGGIHGGGAGEGRALWMTNDDFDVGGMGDAMLPAEGDEERGVGVALFGDDYDNDNDEDDNDDADEVGGENEGAESNEKGENSGNEGNGKAEVPVSLTIHTLTGLLRSSSAPSQRSIGSESRASDSTGYGTALVEYITDALDHPLRGVPTPDHPGLHEKWREAPGRSSSGLGKVKADQAHYDSDNEEDDDEVVALTHGARLRPLDNTATSSPDSTDPAAMAMAASRSRLQDLQDLQDLLDSPRSSPTRIRSPPRPGGGSPSSRGLTAGGPGLDSSVGGSSMPAAFTRPITFADDGVTDLRRRVRASLPHPAARSLPQHRQSSLPPQYWHLGVTFTFEHILEVDLVDTLLGHMVMGQGQGHSQVSEMVGGMVSEMGRGTESVGERGSGVLGEEGMFNRSFDMDLDQGGDGDGDRDDGDDSPILTTANPTERSGLGLGIDVPSAPPVGGDVSVASGGSSLLSKKSLMRLPLHIAVSAR